MSHFTAAVLVEPGGSGVAGTVRLASRLHPNNCIDMGVVQNLLVGRGRDAKASIPDIAPLTPRSADRRLASATLVNDEVGRVASLLEMRHQRLNVVRLVPRVAPLCEVFADDRDVLVVVGHVGGKTTGFGSRVDLLGAFEDLGVKFGGGSQVVVPAKPASVSSIEVDGNVLCLELGNGL